MQQQNMSSLSQLSYMLPELLIAAVGAPVQQQNMCSLSQLSYLLPELFITAVAGAAAEHVFLDRRVVLYTLRVVSTVILKY